MTSPRTFSPVPLDDPPYDSRYNQSDIPPLNLQDIKPPTGSSYIPTPKPLLMPLNSSVLVQNTGDRFIRPVLESERLSAMMCSPSNIGQPTSVKSSMVLSQAINEGRATSRSRLRQKMDTSPSFSSSFPMRTQTKFWRTRPKLPGLDQRASYYSRDRTNN